MAARAPALFLVPPVSSGTASAEPSTRCGTALRLVHVHDDASRRDRDLRNLVLDVSRRLRHLAGRIAKRHGGDVDDLHQTALEIACRRAAAYDPGRGSFFTFIYEPVCYALVDACRRERRALAFAARGLSRGGTGEGQRVALGLDTPATPEERVVAADAGEALARRVAEALAELDPVDRELVVRHAIEGVPISQVNRELGIATYKQAWRRYVAAVGRVRRRLGRGEPAHSQDREHPDRTNVNARIGASRTPGSAGVNAPIGRA